MDGNFQRNGFDIEESFGKTDAGRHEKRPQPINDTDLNRLLRSEKSKREGVPMMNPIISPETCEFRDECVEYFHKDHTKLLSEYIRKVGYIKKLDQMN